MRRSLLLIFLVLAPACSEPVSPEEAACARLFACQTPGVDIEIVSISVASTATDQTTKFGIFQPGAPIQFKIRNRGSVESAAGELYIDLEPGFVSRTTVPYEALAPGEEFQGSVVVNLPSLIYYESAVNDRVTVTAEVFPRADTVRSNNKLRSDSLHLAVPILQITYTTTTEIVKAGQPAQLRVTAKNISAHADAPAQQLTGCLYRSSGSCTPRFHTTTGGWTLPPLPAATVKIVDVALMIPASAAWQDAAFQYLMYLCTGRPVDYDVDRKMTCDSNARSIEVRPDYERVCSPPALQSNVPIHLSAYNCGLRPSVAGFEADTRRYRFHLVSFDARNGVTYAIQRSDTLSSVRIYGAEGYAVFDQDANPERIRVGGDQRIYVVMYSSSEALDITVSEAAGGA